MWYALTARGICGQWKVFSIWGGRVDRSELLMVLGRALKCFETQKGKALAVLPSGSAECGPEDRSIADWWKQQIKDAAD